MSNDREERFARIGLPWRIETGDDLIERIFDKHGHILKVGNGGLDQRDVDLVTILNMALSLPTQPGNLNLPWHQHPTGEWQIIDCKGNYIVDCSRSFEKGGDQSHASNIAAAIVRAVNAQIDDDVCATSIEDLHENTALHTPDFLVEFVDAPERVAISGGGGAHSWQGLGAGAALEPPLGGRTARDIVTTAIEAAGGPVEEVDQGAVETIIAAMEDEVGGAASTSQHGVKVAGEITTAYKAAHDRQRYPSDVVALAEAIARIVDPGTPYPERWLTNAEMLIAYEKARLVPWEVTSLLLQDITERMERIESRLELSGLEADQKKVGALEAAATAVRAKTDALMATLGVTRNG